MMALCITISFLLGLMVGLFIKSPELDDWYSVWDETAWWTSDRRTVATCEYRIEYSPSRRAYRLKADGYDATEHPYYATALTRLTDFREARMDCGYKAGGKKVEAISKVYLN